MARQCAFDEAPLEKKRNPPFFPGLADCARGFTLIEILLAFFIFGIVAATLFGSYGSVFSSADAVLQGVSDNEMGLSAIHRMVLDFSAVSVLLPPVYGPQIEHDKGDPYRFSGQKEWITDREFSLVWFSSLAQVPMGAKSAKTVSMIRYFVESVGTDEFVLKRWESPYPYFEAFSSEKSPVVCDRVRSFTVMYYDENGKAFDRWDSEDANFGRATPKAVQVHLEIGDAASFRTFETRITLPVYRTRLDR